MLEAALYVRGFFDSSGRFSPSYLQPGEQSLYVWHAGVWQRLVEHTQQQTVNQGEGQGGGQSSVRARAPRWGHAGEMMSMCVDLF